jgi:hypothetical protein
MPLYETVTGKLLYWKHIWGTGFKAHSNKKCRAGRVVQIVECLPSKCKALTEFNSQYQQINK